MAIFLSPEFEKQFLPMVLTDEGIEMCSRLVQPSKQYSPNNVTVEGTFIVIRLVQFLKQFPGKYLINDLLLTVVKLVQFSYSQLSVYQFVLIKTVEK